MNMWWARMRGRAEPARCSSIPGRVRTGRVWGGNCWPTSRCSPRRSPSWNPTFVEQVGFSLQQVLATVKPCSGDAQVQPVLMGLQLALTQLWRSYGVHPDAVIGHSMGEVTAAVVAGALSVVDGFRVIAIRSRLMSRLAGQGAVALLKLDAEAAEALSPTIPKSASRVHFAAPNGDRRGARPGRRGNRRGERAEPIRPSGQHGGRVAHRVDGPDPARIARGARDLTPKSPTIPFFSTVLEAPRADAGRRVLGGQRAPAGLFIRRVAAAGQDHGTFIEVSAHPMLTQAVSETLDRSAITTASARCGATATTPSVSIPTSTPPTPSTRPQLRIPPNLTRSCRPRRGTTPTTGSMIAQSSAAMANPGAPSSGVIPSEWYCELTWPARALSERPEPLRRRLVAGGHRCGAGRRDRPQCSAMVRA